MDVGMMADDPLAAAAALSQTLQAVAAARARLKKLRDDYAIVSDSKFARARSLVGTLWSLAIRSKEPGAGALGSIAGDCAGLGTRDGVAQPVDIEHLNLIDALAVERAMRQSPTAGAYSEWLRQNGTRVSDLTRMRELVELLPYRPTISIITAVFNTPEPYLRATIESVLAQVYPSWELCLADDASTEAHVRTVLHEFAARDPRVKVTFRASNGHISRAMNSALDLATGEFVGILDHDDLLTPDALFEVAALLNWHRDADMIYSDEDKIDDAGTLRDPFFKPDWCPESFMSRMYTCHFGVYRRSLVERVGRFRPEFDGSQDYDLVLRLSEQSSRIHHIPRVLYHWRIHAASTASASTAKPYASTAAEKALGEALDRRGEPGEVREVEGAPGTYLVRYRIKEHRRVSIIVPTRDHGDDVDRCLGSIFSKTTYPNFEVVLLDNGSSEPTSLATFERWALRDQRVRVLRYDVPFNFSRINNYAVSKASGEYLLFLNNDTEVVSTDWLEAMVEQAQRPPIGAVGALLLYPDGTVQHAGVIVGLGGVAGHSHKHYPADSPGYYFMLKAINNYSAVTAACLMVRREVFEQVGGFDKKLTVAFNDVDLCLKIRAAGYRNVSLPHVILYHFESKSRGYEDTSDKIARFDQEINVVKTRWRTAEKADPCYSPNLTLDREDFSLRI
jgi:GT2 family glycosyltransferase